MTIEEARRIILAESMEGIAYTSRMGEYGTKERFSQLIEAINTLGTELAGQKNVERELFAALFVLGNQVEGNVHGALAKGLAVPDWLQEDGLAQLNEALNGIFEDHG